MFLKCRKLKDLDVMSKSDPKVIVYMKTNNSAPWEKIGQTEVLNDNLNPDFKTSFEIFYQFEVH